VDLRRLTIETLLLHYSHYENIKGKKTIRRGMEFFSLAGSFLSLDFEKKEVKLME